MFQNPNIHNSFVKFCYPTRTSTRPTKITWDALTQALVEEAPYNTFSSFVNDLNNLFTKHLNNTIFDIKMCPYYATS